MCGRARSIIPAGASPVLARLQTDYERLELESNDQARKEQLMALELKLAAIRAGRGASPSNSSLEKARQEIEQNA